MTTKSEIHASAGTRRSESVSSVDPVAVKDYLLQHPEFFNQHPALLRDLDIKHESAGAVSLVERQIQLLREKNSSLEKKILHLVQIAQDNESSKSSYIELHADLSK